MDIEPRDRYGSKQIHQRMGPSNSGGGDGGDGDRYKGLLPLQPQLQPHIPSPYLHSKAPPIFTVHVNKLCNYFIAGNCSYGERCKFLHSWFVSDSFSLLTPLQGHQKVITGIALPSGLDKLYSGSKDETIRVWIVRVANVLGLLVWEVKLVA
ncbi:zinc finger CCCH domain-containing protein 17-like [Asparagus officinalis]|uniref:zinc finger CCCH domain-containing protein 17-like n=1 Tax=Asparagus officinalis TaxID=4686 RepID=UPI00098E810A|nr:zinc finger CCCH domain-containing protein 17-like [Asparagus officinalis]